ncbi:MAG: DUF3526 domain-containing protein [Bacteroidota bacterium]
MWQVIKNEWSFMVRSKALIGVSLSFLFVLLMTIVLGNLQTQQQQQQYDAAQAKMRLQWESIEAMNPHSAAHYGTYVFKPSNLLNSLDEGVNSVTGNVLRVEGHVQNEIVHSEAAQMQAVSTFGKLKSALLLQYLIPLLLLFLAFHSFSSEKTSGRLRLLVLQGANPSKLVLGKTLSVWLYGMFLLTLTVLLYALLNWGSITTDILIRTFFFYGTYALYYFIITGLTVLFSARSNNVTVALTSMLGIWILWTIFLPTILMSTIEKWNDLPSRNAFQTAMKEDRSKGIDGHNPSDERGKELEAKTLEEYGVDSLYKLPINFDGLRMQADEEYGNQVWDKHFGHLREVMAQQKKKYQFAGLINPFISLQNASMGFTASDNFHHQEFLVQVEHYRRDFIKMLNDEHAYGGSKTGDWGWKADNAFFKSVPDYHYQAAKLTAVLPKYLVDLLVLGLWVLGVSLSLIFGTKNLQIL